MSVMGTTGADMIDFVEAADLLSSGTVKVSRLLEKTYFDLDHVREAFGEAVLPGRYRVTVHMNDRKPAADQSEGKESEHA